MAEGEIFYHGIRKLEYFEQIRANGLTRGFFTTERDLAERFAVSGYFLSIDSAKIPASDLKKTQYIVGGMPGAQIEYIGKVAIPFAEFQLHEIDLGTDDPR